LVTIVTQAGQSYRPISWIGRRRTNLAGNPRPDLLAPVRIRPDAIAPGQPSRDLLLAPDHGILVDGNLIAVRKCPGPRFIHLPANPYPNSLAATSATRRP
jgi:hypothetical protein